MIQTIMAKKQKKKAGAVCPSIFFHYLPLWDCCVNRSFLSLYKLSNSNLYLLLGNIPRARFNNSASILCASIKNQLKTRAAKYPKVKKNKNKKIRLNKS